MNALGAPIWTPPVADGIATVATSSNEHVLDADLNLAYYYNDRSGRDANASRIIGPALKSHASPLLAHTIHRFLPRGIELITGTHTHAVADADKMSVRRQVENIRIGRWRAHRGHNESMSANE